MLMDSGSIGFIIVCSALVFLMTPGLAFFYGGLGRRKNVINTMMMSIAPLAVASLLWLLVGYSLAFSGDGKLIGDLSHVNGIVQYILHEVP